jgi:hypothetical protein
MQTKDIVVGGLYAVGEFGSLAQVRVTEKGLPGSGFGRTQRNDGVRYEIVKGDAGRGRSNRATSRQIEPWSSKHEAKLARDAAAILLDQRISRVADRLDVLAIYSGHRVSMQTEDFFKLAERLGVDNT